MKQECGEARVTWVVSEEEFLKGKEGEEKISVGSQHEVCQNQKSNSMKMNLLCG